MIEYKNVTVGFESNVVLNNVNLLIDRKSVILGPNGSGKTTLIKATTGLYPYKGNIYVDGQDVRNIKNYLPLSVNLGEVYSLGRKVKDIVYLYEEIKNLDRKTFEGFLREVNLYDQVIDKPLYKLSSGQSLLTRTALALASHPKIALLDEPFENLDPARRLTVVKWIKEYMKEGFITTHELDLLKEFKDWSAYILLNGKLHGPIIVEDLLEASVVEGETSNALVTVETPGGKKISLVKGQNGAKLSVLGSIDRIYTVV